MLTIKQRRLISYESITIYEKTYRLPIIKNTKLKKIQKKIRDCQIFIKDGVRYRNDFWGLIKRKKEISQAEIFQEIQLLMRDYTHVIDFLENYKDSYQDFLLKFTDDWKSLFTQKYLEIKKLNEERNKLEIKNQNNYQILDKLKREKKENLKSILLLSNTNFLMLEKVELLSNGIKNLAEDTKNQKQTIQKIVKELEVYQEFYEYQIKATKVRQEIAKIAETAINFENYLQDYFSPFQSLIDEVVKVDENFYATVGEIKSLANNFLMGESNLLRLEAAEDISTNIINSIVASYEKKERLNDALFQSQLLNQQVQNLNFEDEIALENATELISNYIYKQFVDQRKVLGVVEKKFSSSISVVATEVTEAQLTNDKITATEEFKSSKNIDYTHLQNLLAQHKWKEADMETTKLMLQVIGKSYWNEVYKEDIQNFSCKHLQTIDQLWKQYSHGYFGFSVQQSIWNEIGGQVDYETEKRLGDRLGWRKEGNWLDYDQLTFKLSSTTPIGHLPAKWLHYDQEAFDSSPNSSAEPLSMGAWRVGSWLIWQMHLFFSRVKICNVTCP
ncbi:GUN4 domain-containing protein [Nostoc sp. CENA67]|uniref:GUN4 domain-containing protein n=1 Tax=Amazonocrinis nigriterrae CENA67 TaxID=2794033 RepID=A0A8J7HMY7_9NOST|nr:GUN4 domain-containing protein [Amazonocrinis nigriterrae]MBH8562631.1 GUN4 domain-containing protein [Amazonocrinis nigriterrae CENA67]